MSGRIRWRRVTGADGTPAYRAESDVNGARLTVGEAVMTGRPGVDHYPWDWSVSIPVVPGRKTVGVADTLRSCKAYVAAALESGA